MNNSEVNNSEHEHLDTSVAECRILLDVMIAQGVETIVISPGSRNTPLIIGASARKDLQKEIVSDERAAGFIALGIAMRTRKPVALACTSGTALYNYAPAIAEAYYQKIPLLVLTADRPNQWIDQDDSQTLRQFGALQNIVKKSFNLNPIDDTLKASEDGYFRTEREWYVNRCANEAILLCTHGIPGPVHINLPLSEPLNRTIPYKKEDVRVINYITNNSSLNIETLKELSGYLLDKKVLVIIGFMPPDNKLNKALMLFSKLPNVVIMAETISNMHLDRYDYMIDSVLKLKELYSRDDLKPDIVISIGGALVSRMLKDYIRKCPKIEHWTLNDTDISVDCFQHLTRHIDLTPTSFFRGIGSMMRTLMRKGAEVRYGDYQRSWRDIREKCNNENLNYIRHSSWSELKALERVFHIIPENWNLFLSNGTAVRYSQILASHIPHGCYCNRGVSGIEGTNTTALGLSMGYGAPTLLVTGDVSFSYYPEVLKYVESDLRIIVVNNNGGGIFRFIRTTRELPIRENYFCANPQVPLQQLCKVYQREYIKVENEMELEIGIKKFLQIKGSVMELIVDGDLSADLLRKFLNS